MSIPPIAYYGLIAKSYKQGTITKEIWKKYCIGLLKTISKLDEKFIKELIENDETILEEMANY